VQLRSTLLQLSAIVSHMNLYKAMVIFRLEFEVHSEWVLMRSSILCRFVVETCKCLHRAKYLLMWEAVERLGTDTIQ
jgi:hypothetical protein